MDENQVSSNVVWHQGEITRKDREFAMGTKVLFCGLQVCRAQENLH